MKPKIDIMKCINSVVIEDQGLYADKFSDAAPFPHVVIDDFLPTGFSTELIEQFPDFDQRTAINEDGHVGGKSTREQVRQLGPAFSSLDEAIRSRHLRELVGRITGIDDLLYDPWYFGGGTHENRHGQDLDPHIDFNYHPISRHHRRLNLIVFLNDEWKEHWGGLLQLHGNPFLEPEADNIVSIAPLRNRCVIFETSERSWHGFERIDMPPDK